jgi:hypothetical protein
LILARAVLNLEPCRGAEPLEGARLQRCRLVPDIKEYGRGLTT